MANEKRLIDANALLAELDKFANPMPNKSGYDFLCGISTAITEIEDAPTVDAVEVVHGRWEVIEASDELYKCSACGEWQYIPEEHFAYCPYCGAKMDLED